MTTQTFTHPDLTKFDAFSLNLEARRARDRYMSQLIANAVKGAVAMVRTWYDRRRTVAELKGLDSRTLADIGLDRTALGNGVIRRVEDNQTNAILAGAVAQPLAGAGLMAVRSVEAHLAPAVTPKAEPANSDTRHAA